jgi:hypothetical protein
VCLQRTVEETIVQIVAEVFLEVVVSKIGGYSK